MSFPTTETSDIPLKADSSIVRPQVLLQSRSSNSEKNCCIYCLANVVHPRLGRGESYTCGYKPYRCDICNYSTVTKGNLAIHEQSDRHLNNLQEYDQQRKILCSNELGGAGVSSAPFIDPLSTSLLQKSSNNTRAVGNFHQTSFALPEAFIPKGHQHSLDSLSSNFLEVSDRALFCQVCGIFETDNVEDLISHAEQNRIPRNLDLANQRVTIHTAGTWHCSICAYRSPLKANFQLHCKTEKHSMRLSLLLHMCEGKEGELIQSVFTNSILFSPSSKSNDYCQLRCLPCGFFTCSVHKMRVHCQMPCHAFLAEIFSVVVKERNQLKSAFMGASDVMDNARIIYGCRRCEMTYTTMTAFMEHFQNMEIHDTPDRNRFRLDDVVVLWECSPDGGEQNHCKTVREIDGRRADGEQNSNACVESMYAHQCENEQTKFGEKDTSRSNSLENPDTQYDDENRFGRRSAPPDIHSESITLSQSSKNAAEPDSATAIRCTNDGQMPHPLLTGAVCQTSNDYKSVRCGMHITTDPFSTWLSYDNSQNSELLQGLVKLIDEQKMQTSIPRTYDELFTWFGPDSSFCSFISYWLRYQFPQMDGAISNEFVALILELIAQQVNVSGRFQELHELQQNHRYATCQQCSPPKSFMLPSSMSLHCSIHHNEDLPATVLDAVERMENSVIEIVLAQKFQLIDPATKRTRGRISTDQLEVLLSNYCISGTMTEETVATICEKTGLKEKVVKHWFQSAQLKEAPFNSDNHQTHSNQLFLPEPSEETQQTDHVVKPTSSSKRFRTPISSTQQTVLLQYFRVDQNPSRRQMDIIASKVNLPKRVVQVWFQNARSRERRMVTKYTPLQSQSPKPNAPLAQTATPPWQPKEPSTQVSPLNELECFVSTANPASLLLESAPVNKLAKFLSQIFTHMPPLGIPQPSTPIPVQPLPPHLLTEPSQDCELDCPLDLSTVAYRSNCCQSRTSQNLSPQTGSATNANETKSDNFCRRNRTSISSTQAKFMQWFFQHHKTPTLGECENIGRAIGLSRRVVQVWFQNQRAKEKKLARANAVRGETLPHKSRADSQFLLEGDECKLCDVKIKQVCGENAVAVTEHIFSKAHIDRLFATICQGESWTVTGDKRLNSSSESKRE